MPTPLLRDSTLFKCTLVATAGIVPAQPQSSRRLVHGDDTGKRK